MPIYLYHLYYPLPEYISPCMPLNPSPLFPLRALLSTNSSISGANFATLPPLPIFIPLLSHCLGSYIPWCTRGQFHPLLSTPSLSRLAAIWHKSSCVESTRMEGSVWAWLTHTQDLSLPSCSLLPKLSFISPLT